MISCGGSTPPASPLPEGSGSPPVRSQVPGAANLAFACRPASPSCENPGFAVEVLGDQVESCEAQSGGTSLRLQVKSSNDPHDGILVAFDGYHGPDTYSLDTPGVRFLNVDDAVSFAQCAGPAINVGKRVNAADRNCGSPACTVQVTDATPGAAFPKPLTFVVHCASLCENGGDVTCAGPFDFTVHADCT